MPKTRKPPRKTWKAKPKIVLKVTGDSPHKPEPSGDRSGEHASRTLSRTAYRNRLVNHLSGLCDQITMDTFKALNLQFLHFKDQIYGLTVGQLEELVYAFTLLATCQHTMTYAFSKAMHTRHRALLRRLRKGLTLE
jgi:hypothetical protein